MAEFQGDRLNDRHRLDHLFVIAVAILTLSYVTTRVFSEEEADDASWSSMVGEQATCCWGFLQPMSGIKEYPKGSNKGGMTESL